MAQRYIWVFIVVLLVAVSFVLGTYANVIAIRLGFPVALSVSDRQVLQGGAQTTTQAVVVHGTVISNTSGRLVIEDSNRTLTTYATTDHTAVFSTVTAGVSGKNVADIMAGDNVTVTPTLGTKNAALVVLIPEAPLRPAPEEMSTLLLGEVTAVDGSNVTIQPSNASTTRTVTIDASTTITTQVRAGAHGYGLSNIATGMNVVASGLTAVDGQTTVRLFQILLSTQ